MENSRKCFFCVSCAYVRAFEPQAVVAAEDDFEDALGRVDEFEEFFCEGPGERGVEHDVVAALHALEELEQEGPVLHLEPLPHAVVVRELQVEVAVAGHAGPADQRRLEVEDQPPAVVFGVSVRQLVEAHNLLRSHPISHQLVVVRVQEDFAERARHAQLHRLELFVVPR